MIKKVNIYENVTRKNLLELVRKPSENDEDYKKCQILIKEDIIHKKVDNDAKFDFEGKNSENNSKCQNDKKRWLLKKSVKTLSFDIFVNI